MQCTMGKMYLIITAVGLILCASGAAVWAEEAADSIVDIPIIENSEEMAPAQAPRGNSTQQSGCGSLEPRDARYCSEENNNLKTDTDNPVIDDIPDSEETGTAS